jgi:hypothetical protein
MAARGISDPRWGDSAVKAVKTVKTLKAVKTVKVIVNLRVVPIGVGVHG